MVAAFIRYCGIYVFLQILIITSNFSIGPTECWLVFKVNSYETWTQYLLVCYKRLWMRLNESCLIRVTVSKKEKFFSKPMLMKANFRATMLPGRSEVFLLLFIREEYITKAIKQWMLLKRKHLAFNQRTENYLWLNLCITGLQLHLKVLICVYLTKILSIIAMYGHHFITKT